MSQFKTQTDHTGVGIYPIKHISHITQLHDPNPMFDTWISHIFPASWRIQFGNFRLFSSGVNFHHVPSIDHDFPPPVIDVAGGEALQVTVEIAPGRIGGQPATYFRLGDGMEKK